MAKPVPAPTFYAVACLAAGIAGALYLGQHRASDRVSIPILAHGVEAYTAIQAGDLTTLQVPGRHLRKSTVKDRSQLVGHYGFARLPAGTAVEANQLGPSLPAQWQGRVWITSVPLGAAAKLNAPVEAGSVVDLVFTGRDAPDPISGVYVLHVDAILGRCWRFLPGAETISRARCRRDS